MLLATTVKKIFFAIIVLSAIVRVYYFFVLPEGAYNDSLYHLNIVGKILGQKTFSLQGIDVPPPFYYSVFASLLSQSHLGLNSFTAKIFPFAIELLSLILAFVVFKKMFNENYFVPLAFFSVFPWVVRFSGINYAENLSVVFVLWLVERGRLANISVGRALSSGARDWKIHDSSSDHHPFPHFKELDLVDHCRRFS